jgi:hypothetical protein
MRLKKGADSQTEPGKRMLAFIVGTRKRVLGERSGISSHLSTKENAVGRHTVSPMLERGTPSVTIEVEGKTKRLILDAGSIVSILEEGVKRNEIKETPLKPFGVTGEVLATKGQQSVSFRLGGKKYDHMF